MAHLAELTLADLDFIRADPAVRASLAYDLIDIRTWEVSKLMIAMRDQLLEGEPANFDREAFAAQLLAASTLLNTIAAPLDAVSEEIARFRAKEGPAKRGAYTMPPEPAHPAS